MVVKEVTVRESTVVRPAEETPRESLWISNMDMKIVGTHTPSVYIYKPRADGEHKNFFDPHVLKHALSKALVPFYPLAGRLKRDGDENSRVEINCNAEGALFVVADSDSCVDDFGDFNPTPEFGMALIPPVDYSAGITSFPMLLVQFTYLKCSGVVLGVALEHGAADGLAALHFINTWADMARGLDIGISPVLDRTVLRARDPPQPLKNHTHHLEYPSPKANGSDITAAPAPETKVSVFKFTKEQINILKAKSAATDTKEENGDDKKAMPIKYTTNQVLCGHVWKCTCTARELGDDEETKLYIAVDARSRVQPPLPPGFFGNAIFRATPTSLAGDLISKPLGYAASCVRNAVARMDDEYIKSALDYLELQPVSSVAALARGSHFRSPNLGITTWVGLPLYDADFGWGRPVFMGRAGIPSEGKAYIIPSASNDGSFSMAIHLQSKHMESFSKLVYEI